MTLNAEAGMRVTAVLLAISLGLSAASTVSAEAPAAKPAVRTDRGAYPPPPAPALPKAGGVFTDPVFGTEILRVTDEADGKENNQAYSYWPSFNRDSTRLHIACGNRRVLYRFDPKAFRIVGKEPLFGKRPPNGPEPRWDDAMWSADDPDVLYCHEGLRLWAYNVAKQEYALVKDFSKDLPPGHLCQMSKSADDKVFAGSLQDPKWKRTGYFAWRRDTDKIVLHETAEHDEVQTDKTGRWCVIKTGKQGKGVIRVRIADLASGKIEDLTDAAPDYAPGHSDNGRSTLIGHDNHKNRVTLRRMDAPHAFAGILEFKDDWSQGYHVSMCADDESWATLSLYVSNRFKQSGEFTNEIIQAATDGSGRVRRLAHHRSVFRSYWDSPRANISRDGRFVVFTSNWEGTGQRDVFVLRVPPLIEAAPAK
jgi:hypothetical protein